MTGTDALTERIARALHADDAETGHAADDWETMSAASIAWYRSNAAAVLPIVAAEVRKAKAEALREAADAWHAENHGTMPRPYRWMWDRADTIEKGDGQ